MRSFNSELMVLLLLLLFLPTSVASKLHHFNGSMTILCWKPFNNCLESSVSCCLYMPFQEESVAINIDVLQHRSAYSHYLSWACVLSSSLNGLEETTTQRNWYPPGEFLPGGARRGSVGDPSTGCHANPKQQLRAGGCGSHEWSPVPFFLEFTSILMPQPKVWFRRETPHMTFLPRDSVAELQPKENKC